MNSYLSFIRLSTAVAALCISAGLAAPAHAADPAPGTVDLIATPPELTAKVAPNVVLTYDDSGSMAWDYMPDKRPYDSGSWGSTYWRCAGVIDARVTDPLDVKSWSMNGVYYNPNTIYRPPLDKDGVSFPNATFTAAWENGIQHNRPNNSSNSTLRNLTSRAFCGKTGAGYYQLSDTVNLIVDANGKITNTSDLYTSNKWDWIPLPVGQQQNFANWFSYYRTRQMAAISGTSHAFASFDKSIRIGWQNINANVAPNKFIAAGTTELKPFEGALRTQFYNWLFSNPASSGTPNQPATDRVGKLFSYGAGVSSIKNPYWDPDTSRELACRKNFHILMTDGMWNGGTVAHGQNDTTGHTLPDGRTFSTSDLESKIIWNEDGSAQQKMADIAYHYWATDLRPDFKNSEQTKLKVRPYLADRTTGLTGSTPLQPGDDWLDNKEVYWNPVNNPATWPHVVQYMIGFGVDGTIPSIASNYEKLRKGEIQWPKMPGGDTAEKIDDMWHAAINSRGQFFAAANPDELVDAMQKIIASVVAQSTSSTPAAVTLPLLTGGNSVYEGGYDTTGWPGSLRRAKLDAAGIAGEALWDAGCLLTGGVCAVPPGSNPVRDPDSRIIITSKTVGATQVGTPFRWSDLSTSQQTALNLGGNGAARVSYLRGNRDNEALTATPRFRSRVSLLGAVVNGEPAYVSSPSAGYRDVFPTGSPEAVAAGADDADSYAGYQNIQRKRKPMVYVGANDGMLHAFDADTGKEAWAYVPDTLIRNGRIASSTAVDAELVPGVDAMPRESDVFIDGEWRTLLLGSLRLGGRGIYALDVTDPVPSGGDSETSAASRLVKWEFTNGDTPSTTTDAPCAAGSTSCASLGYTYDSVNVARIKANNKWVALVSSGYFPESAFSAAQASDIYEAAADRTSLLIIDLESGELIREIKTSAAPQTRPSGFRTFGLSTPMVYDVGSDDVSDLVYAGDLAGNLWRFDISDGDPAQWKVDLMFTTYKNGGAINPGDQPIVFNPSALRDPVTLNPILVFGTGKYLGEGDRTIAVPMQAHYGIRDYGTASTHYPIKVNQLVKQNLSQSSDVRQVTGYTDPASSPSTAPYMRMNGKDGSGNAIVSNVRAHGWFMPLNITTEKGERAQRRAIPLPSANVTMLYGLIPKSDDPCDPGARYSIMALDAATGAAIGSSGGMSTGEGVVGAVLAAPTPPSDPVGKRGGSGGIVVGLPPNMPDPVKEAIESALEAAIPPWHRGAWRELLGW